MKVFIVGQKWLAAELLGQCVTRGHNVVGVAAPDQDDRLARAAIDQGIPASSFARRLPPEAVPLGTDLIIAANAHCFIAADARARSRLGALGYHPSLLPRHRGRDAIRWAIHMGERITGGTVYWIDDGADTGPIALQAWCHIRPDDTPASLWRRELGPMGLRLLGDAAELAGRGALPGVVQDEAVATWEPSFQGARLSSFREAS